MDGMAESLRFADLQPVGKQLHRPECVLCTSDGNVFVSDWSGGVCRIAPNGEQTQFIARQPPVDLKPNGIALTRDGDFLIANLGDAGGVWRLQTNGELSAVLTEVDGVPLPPTNFVLIDHQQRIWITVSTRTRPRADAYRRDVADGFIVLVDDRGARVVADGLGYTNEVQLHPSGRWLYVNETFGRRTSRMTIGADGSLGKRQTVAEYGYGTFPDGLCFAENGDFWVVSLVSNRIIHVARDGTQTVLIEDVDAEFLAQVETAFQSGTMGRPHLDTIKSHLLRSVSSIAFGGRDRRSSYLGCLLDDRIMTYRSPIAGVSPVHWHWRAK